jgi:hypothetical protein
MLWFIILFAGVCHIRQSSIIDYIRDFHFCFVKGHFCENIEYSTVLKRQFDNFTWNSAFIQKLKLFLVVKYRISQENYTPCMQMFRMELGQHYGYIMPEKLCEDFVNESGVILKYGYAFTFGVRIFIALLSFYVDMPWLYFLYEICVLNLLLVYVNRKHEDVCARFLDRVCDDV